MAEVVQTISKKKPNKKETRKQIFEKLSGALEEYKDKLSEKKFETKLKKATRLFATDIIRAIKKDRKKQDSKEEQVREVRNPA